MHVRLLKSLKNSCDIFGDRVVTISKRRFKNYIPFGLSFFNVPSTTPSFDIWTKYPYFEWSFPFRTFVDVALTRDRSIPLLFDLIARRSLEPFVVCLPPGFALACVKLKALDNAVRFFFRFRSRLDDVWRPIGLVLTTTNVCKHRRTTPNVHNTWKENGRVWVVTYMNDTNNHTY